MIISLDLDGVLCDLPSATLMPAHAMHRTGQIGDDDLRGVYMRALPKAHPSSFAAPGDEIIIVTGRLPITHGWTLEWLVDHGMSQYRVELVGSPDAAAAWARGDPDGAMKWTAAYKARACRRRGVDLHVDNNPEIVKRMRALGVHAVCVRL